MFELIRIGEHTIHNGSFEVNRPHGYPVYLLLIVRTEAKFLIDEEWQDIDPGTIFLYKPGQKHRYCAKAQKYIDDWAHIKCDTFLLGEHFPYGKPIQVNDPESYYALIYMLCQEYFGVKSNGKIVIHHLLMALLQKIQGENELAKFPPLYYDISKIRKRIYNHPEYQWSVSKIAKELNISKAYLQRIYQKFYGTTCMNDVIDSRIQSASELLLSTNKTLDEVSKLCGYNHTEHFVRQFKKKYGISPGKYRRCINR